MLVTLALLGLAWLVMVFRDLRARLNASGPTLDLNHRPVPLFALLVTFRAEGRSASIPTVTLTGTLAPPGAPALYHHTPASLAALCAAERPVTVRFTWHGATWCAEGTLTEVTETRSGVPCFTVRASCPAIEGESPPSSEPLSSRRSAPPTPRSAPPSSSEAPPSSATVEPDLKHGASSGVSKDEDTPPDTKPTGR